jgi:hypothetical protein
MPFLDSAANLTAFVSAAQAVANTTEGAAFLAAINQTYSYDRTLFAPTNQVSASWHLFEFDMLIFTCHSAQAFANVSESVSSNMTMLANILS